MKTKLTKLDVLAILFVLVLAFLPLLFSMCFQQEVEAVRVISEVGEAVYPLSLDRKIEIVSNGYKLVIEISDGAAFVENSDCADGICVASGKVRTSGDLIVCAPAGVRIEPVTDEVDYVVG